MNRPHAFVYYVLAPESIALGYTEKAGATSIKHALVRCKRLTCDEVRQRSLRTRIYLRHPITRFASAWAYFSPSNNFPGDPVWRNKAYDTLRDHPTLEQFTDVVLEGRENEHWSPQLAQHGLMFDEIYQFERIHETWPERFNLEHRNKGRISKPKIIYRLAELQRFYSDDLVAWRNADPCFCR